MSCTGTHDCIAISVCCVIYRKLRRGDPFTERGPTDWSPPDCKERQKKGAAKKSTTTGKVFTGIRYIHTCITEFALCLQRRVLQEVQNQL